MRVDIFPLEITVNASFLRILFMILNLLENFK